MRHQAPNGLLIRHKLQLVSLINTALTNASITNAQVGSEWPPKDVMQDAGKDMIPIVAVLHKGTSYKAETMPFKHSTTTTAPGIASLVSDFSLALVNQ